MAPELPRIFLLPTHLQADEVRELEARIPTLTHDAREAGVILGRISRPERALFELRRLKLATEPVALEEAGGEVGQGGKRGRSDMPELPSKRPRLSVSGALGTRQEEAHVATLDLSRGPEDIVLVLKLAWLLDSLEQGVALPADDYLLYRGRRLSSPSLRDSSLGASQSRKENEAGGQSHVVRSSSAVLARAMEDQQRSNDSPYSKRTARPRTGSSSTSEGRIRTGPPTLYHETTSEHDVPLPLVPDFLHTTYSCQRPSLVNPPNAAFIAELKAIRTLRLLRGDQVGVRAYSTSIASLAAYPHHLQRAQGKFVLHRFLFSSGCLSGEDRG